MLKSIRLVGTFALCLAFAMAFWGADAQNAYAKEKFLIFGGGNTGGLYYPMAGVFSNLINKHIKGYRASAEVTGASVDNCIFVGTKRMDLGLSNTDTIMHANQGDPPQFRDEYDLAALFQTFTSCVQFYVLKDSPYQSVSDLKGKRISCGSPGSATIWKTKIVLRAHGIDFDDVKPAYLSFGEGANALIDHNVDACVMFLQPRSSAIIDLTTRANVRVLPYSEEVRSRILKEHPYLQRGKVPGGILRGIEKDVPVIASGNPCFVRSNYDPEFSYKYVKMVAENLDYIYRVLPILKNELTLENMTKVPEVVPFHPSAVKYFKEEGLM